MICTWTTTHDECTTVFRLDGDLDHTTTEEFTTLTTARLPVFLDNRGRALDRLLQVTGTSGYLTGEATGVAERHGHDT
ncbi:hypothetical protein L3Q67_30140 [Saccharothrix sp. AJ9571]|nr:hypothetical protein L3Q67_30140 [Saccharothrix sp. AJ9571]